MTNTFGYRVQRAANLKAKIHTGMLSGERRRAGPLEPSVSRMDSVRYYSTTIYVKFKVYTNSNLTDNLTTHLLPTCNAIIVTVVTTVTVSGHGHVAHLEHGTRGRRLHRRRRGESASWRQGKLSEPCSLLMVAIMMAQR